MRLLLPVPKKQFHLNAKNSNYGCIYLFGRFPDTSWQIYLNCVFVIITTPMILLTLGAKDREFHSLISILMLMFHFMLRLSYMVL